MQNAKIEDIPKLRQEKAIFDIIVVLLSLSAITVMNLVVFPKSFDKEIPYLITSYVCGTITMCLFCIYHIMITMKIGYHSVVTLLYAVVVQMTVSPAFSLYGIRFSKPGFTAWAGFLGAFLADVIAYIVLCARHKYDSKVSKMPLEAYKLRWKDKQKSGCMDACGIFFNCILVMYTFGGMIKYYAYPNTQLEFFDVVKSKLNPRVLIQYGATAIIASLVMYANKNHVGKSRYVAYNADILPRGP